MLVLNPWTSTEAKKVYFNLEGKTPTYQYKNYSIYKLGEKHYLYMCESSKIAFNELAGINKEHLENVANNTAPTDSMKYTFKRALETLEKWKALK